MNNNKYNGILIIFHCPENTGYAIKPLKDCFLEVAKKIAGHNVHVSYTSVQKKTRKQSTRIIEFNPERMDRGQLNAMVEYVKENGIDLVLGFDQAPGKKYYKYLRRAGIKKIVSYWGASISDRNRGLKLLLKKLEMRLRINSPDLYIFESEAMRDLAVYGRGIKKNITVVSSLGVDTEKYKPNKEFECYARAEFNIPLNRKIVYYSGHMEPRKGVMVLMKAAINLVDERKRNDFHFLILGNRNGEEAIYKEAVSKTGAKEHVTFGGYRNDIEIILPGCYVGVIASTGWDSFTMSSLEMASSGLPLVVSNLQGLAETVEDTVTGYVFEPGSHKGLADKLIFLSDNREKRDVMSLCARKRILSSFSRKHQIESLYKILRK